MITFGRRRPRADSAIDLLDGWLIPAKIICQQSFRDLPTQVRQHQIPCFFLFFWFFGQGVLPRAWQPVTLAQFNLWLLRGTFSRNHLRWRVPYFFFDYNDNRRVSSCHVGLVDCWISSDFSKINDKIIWSRFHYWAERLLNWVILQITSMAKHARYSRTDLCSRDFFHPYTRLLSLSINKQPLVNSLPTQIAMNGEW